MDDVLTRDAVTGLIDDRPDEGIFRVNRRVFTDPAVFELEMKHLFEGGWVFLGLASQVAKPNDFFTTSIGRQPILMTRDAGGEVHAFVNSCPHKGAKVCQVETGNARLFVCPYHSWSFDNAGQLKAIKGKSTGAYSEGFDRDDHNLSPLPRLAEYRGFLFGSLTADVPSLDDHLGDARTLLDLVVDQSAQGLELVPGVVTFTYDANWKLQLENCSDQYHQPGARRVNDRRVISGILHVLKVGCRWCDCPAEYGPSTTVYNRFNRWSNRGFWLKLLDALVDTGAVTKSTAIDSTYVKAQRSAFGAKGGARAKRSAVHAAAGTTKVHERWLEESAQWG